MASSSGQKNWNQIDNALLEQFIAVTGASKVTGKRLLEACNGNLDMAIGMFMDNNGVGLDQEPSTSSGGATAMATEGAAAMPGTSLVDDESEVRAPIPQKNEVLLQEHHYPTYAAGSQEDVDLELLGFRGTRRRPPRSVFDGFRDFQAETRQQSEWGGGPPKTKKRKTLEDLFRPPLDLMHKGTFHSARDVGTKTNKWLIVNIQNVKEFGCQVLNRDVWSQTAVKTIIQEHFVFWQVYHDSEEGRKYTQFYKINQWPYIAVLDPRTGENLVIWNKVDAMTFCDLVTEFLSDHPSLDGGTSPPTKKQRTMSIVEESEDSQLEAALKASLEESQKSLKKSNSVQYISDSNSDTELETFSDSEEGDNEKDHSKNNSDSATERGDLHKNTGSKQSGKSGSKSSGVAADGANSKSVAQSGMICDKNTKYDSAYSSGSQGESSKSGGKASKKLSGKNMEEDLQGCSGDEGRKKVAVDDDDWKQHLGKEEDPLTSINIRFPNGNREQVRWPCSSKLFALVQFVVSKGFSNERYELVTNFPRRQLSYMDFDQTLKQVGLHPQETVFVQER